MQFSRETIFFIIVVVIVILIILIILYVKLSIKSVKGPKHIELEQPEDFHAIRVKDGYLLRWKFDHNVHGYDLYIGSGQIYDIYDPHLNLLQNIYPGFILTDSYLQEGSTKLLLSSYVKIKGKHNISPPAYLDLDLGKSNLPAPVLKCFGGFDFEGQFQSDAELCYQQSTDNRVLLQWHPVPGAKYYKVYSRKGSKVTPSTSTKRYKLPYTSYYMLSDVLPDNTCWAFMVTAVDYLGRETESSQIYTTCEGP